MTMSQKNLYLVDDSYRDNDFFNSCDPDKLWIYDKLILSKKLGYICGPVGIEVPFPNNYIVRPVMNFQGLGLGAKKIWIDNSTDDLPVGYFWCQWFEGNHYSVDYNYGLPKLTVQGTRGQSISKWRSWKKVDHYIEFPKILDKFIDYPWINCEFIGDKLIEVHVRRNPDFKDDSIIEYIPKFYGDSLDPPAGYEYIDDPELHGRVGAWVKKSKKT